MKPTIQIGLQPGTKMLRLERRAANRYYEYVDGLVVAENGDIGYWTIWLSAARDFSQGTFLRLYDNGEIEQVTCDADGIERVIRIKDEDK